MREIRLSGSEGGGTGNSTGPPYPYHAYAPVGGFPSFGCLPSFMSLAFLADSAQ